MCVSLLCRSKASLYLSLYRRVRKSRLKPWFQKLVVTFSTEIFDVPMSFYHRVFKAQITNIQRRYKKVAIVEYLAGRVIIFFPLTAILIKFRVSKSLVKYKVT